MLRRLLKLKFKPVPRLVRLLSTPPTSWAFRPAQTPSTLISRCQKEALSHARTDRRLIQMLRLVREMKAEGVKPDLVIYNALLTCIAHEGLPLEAWAVVDDMTAMGIPPDRQSYHHLLHVSSALSVHAEHSSFLGVQMVIGGHRVASPRHDEKPGYSTNRTNLRPHHRTRYRNREPRACSPVHA